MSSKVTRPRRKKQKYLYGIVKTDRGLQLGAVGLGGSTVHAITYHGLACVASDFFGDGFANLSKDELIRQLFVHQAVLEQVMNLQSVLPVRFGTVLADEKEARDLLSQAYSRLAEAVANTEGKVEVEVAATWEVSKVLQEVAHEPEIVHAREAVAGLPGREGVERQVRLGRMVKEALDRRRDSYRQRMIDFLMPLALAAQSNVLVSDQMVMNVAFIVDRERQKEFDRQVQQLNGLFCEEINFRIVGPLPLYSFSTAEIARPDWSEIEEAKRTLSLGDTISEAIVRNAYRDLAATNHPDFNRGDAGAESRFAKLRSAANILLAYCQGINGPGDVEKTCPLTKSAVESAFVVNVQRSAGDEVESSRFGGLGRKT